jgi:hypothetical protein
MIPTIEEICAYREIYYETVKPMLMAGKSQDDIDFAVKYMCEEYDLSYNRYHEIKLLDLIQRFDGIKNVRINGVDANLPEGFPIIRCPRRSEQPIEVE